MEVKKLNLSGISKELIFLLNIISDNKKKEINDYGVPSEMDWELFLELAIHHRLYPNLAVRLRSLCIPSIPKNIVNKVNQYFEYNTFLMLQYSSEMSHISSLFSENGIRSLFLKGPILAKELYGDISLRTSSDLDLLVELKDLSKVDKLLTEKGYVKDEYIQSILSDWKWRHHHFTYINPINNIKIEIHWRLNPGPGREPSFNYLWSRKETSLYTGKPIHYLGHVDLFYFLVTHGARHGWSRLRWLVDIHQLIQKNVSCSLIWDTLKKYHVESIGKQAILLSREILGTKLSKEWVHYLDEQSTKLAQEAVFYLERMVNLHNEPLPEEIACYHKRHLVALMSNYHKILFGLSTLYPYPEDATTLPLPRYFHFLYFPLRPFIWLWRKTTKHAFS
ncbi:nucleotidyltransferase domain-containing protein [Robertmurraya sp. FSL R5-0851]|uniref:nucleotidyltransferase domain-containing protein n=1 Tax=Robertmurraya sp. FSL R5-0851 TaxID=2921584 RepID=UPI0030FBA02C